MADNYLITGYCGKNHVTAENDRGIHAGIFGAGRYVLPVGKQFKAENIGNNTIRIYDGKLVDNGAAAGIPAGEYVDLVIPNASQGMNRNDLIVFQYSQETSTLIESGTFVVVRGTETSGTASDPTLSQEDLLSGRATFDQMALWRIPVSTGTISTPVQLFKVSKSLDTADSNIVVDAVSSDGVSYSATVEDLEELYSGLKITVIPKVESKSDSITLNVNGLGAKSIRVPLSFNTSVTTAPEADGYFDAEQPVELMYNASYLNKGAWMVHGRQKTSAQDLYGLTPISSGGTGAGNAADALSNLGAQPRNYYHSATDFGSTNASTASEIVTNLPNNSVFVCDASELTDSSWNFPTPYALIRIEKCNVSRLVIQLFSKESKEHWRMLLSGSNSTPSGQWIEAAGMQFVKLWENASPSSSFTAQSISIDGLSKYLLFLITTNTNAHILRRDTENQRLSTATGAQSDLQIATRTTDIGDTSVQFGDCYAGTLAATAGIVANTVIIPRAIYGIKGVYS